MGQAIRDFIPDGEEATPVERTRMQRGRIIRTGANNADFIPDPNDPTVPVVKRSPEERHNRAMQAAAARAEYASRNEFRVAQLRLKEMSPAQAVNAIEVMPLASLEMYLAAEQLGAARHDILSLFPPIDPSVVERYREQLASQEVVEEEVAPVAQSDSEGHEPTETVQATVSEPADAAEVFFCLDCDHEPFTTVAGMKSHVRAKHS
jgi:hypothetical protein